MLSLLSYNKYTNDFIAGIFKCLKYLLTKTRKGKLDFAWIQFQTKITRNVLDIYTNLGSFFWTVTRLSHEGGTLAHATLITTFFLHFSAHGHQEPRN